MEIEKVVTDDEMLIFHNPSSLHSTIDMIEMEVEEAKEHGAKPCGRCFANSGFRF